MEWRGWACCFLGWVGGVGLALEFFEALGVDDAEFGGGWEVVLESAWGVDRVELGGGVPAGELENDSGASWVGGEELCYIVNSAMEDYPAALCGVVLGNWISGQQMHSPVCG